MPEKVKDIIYTSALYWAKMYSKIRKQKTISARIFLVSDKTILLVQHRKSLLWNLPGGGKKKKETLEECAIRELFEETKIIITTVDYRLGTYVLKKENRQNIISIFVKKIPNPLPPKAAFELKQATWFSFSELPEKISPATRARIQEYLQGVKDTEGSW